MIPGCGHEEEMVACAPCAAWAAAQPAECEGRDFCSDDNGWVGRDLKPATDDGHTRMLCPKCRADRNRAIAWESRGDDAYDRMKDEGMGRS